MNILKFLELLRPREILGGLTVSDSSVRFVDARKGLIHASLRLPPNIVSEGRIKDEKVFTQAVFHIKNQIEPHPKKKVKIIFSLPANGVFVQTFRLPLVAKENVREAAELNLKILSPFGKEEAYYDWQLTGETGTQLEFVGAFAQKALVDTYVRILNECGFQVIAVEFPAASLIRLIRNYGANLEQKLPHIILNVDYDGLDFSIMRNSSLCFEYFHSWSVIQGDARQVPWNDFEIAITEEMRKVLNFYNSQWGKIESVILVSQNFTEKIATLIREKYNLTVNILTLREGKNISSQLTAPFGAALRGVGLSSGMGDFSLGGADVRGGYFYEQLFTTIDFWRNIATATFIVIIAASIGVLGFINTTSDTLSATHLTLVAQNTNASELQTFVQSAGNFNRLVSSAENANRQRMNWEPLLGNILRLSGPRIVFNKLSVSTAMGTQVSIDGTGVDESAISEFEKKMQEQSEFSDVILPLTSVKPAPDGRVSFILSFKIR